MDEPDAAPLRGLLTDESESEVRIQVDSGGVWIIQKADAEIVDRTASARDTAGRPVDVRVRAGASVQLLQTLQVGTAGRPMTLSDGLASVLGQEQLDDMARSWAADLHLPQPAFDGGETYSYMRTCDEINGCYDGVANDSLDLLE